MHSFVTTRMGTWVWRVPCRKFKSCANRILGLDELHTFVRVGTTGFLFQFFFFRFGSGCSFPIFFGSLWIFGLKTENMLGHIRARCSWLEGGTHQMFPICLQLAAGKTWQSLIYTVYTYELIFIYTIKTMGVNKTTIAYLRVLTIETGSTIILMVVEAQGIHILFTYNYHHYYVVVTYIYI